MGSSFEFCKCENTLNAFECSLCKSKNTILNNNISHSLQRKTNNNNNVDDIVNYQSNKKNNHSSLQQEQQKTTSRSSKGVSSLLETSANRKYEVDYSWKKFDVSFLLGDVLNSNDNTVDDVLYHNKFEVKKVNESDDAYVHVNCVVTKSKFAIFDFISNGISVDIQQHICNDDLTMSHNKQKALYEINFNSDRIYAIEKYVPVFDMNSYDNNNCFGMQQYKPYLYLKFTSNNTTNTNNEVYEIIIVSTKSVNLNFIIKLLYLLAYI